MRTLLILILVLAGIWWLRRVLGRSRSDARPKGDAAPPGGAVPERMVACAHCGVHVPESESVRGSRDEFYCCDEHRRLGSGA